MMNSNVFKKLIKITSSVKTSSLELFSKSLKKLDSDSLKKYIFIDWSNGSFELSFKLPAKINQLKILSANSYSDLDKNKFKNINSFQELKNSVIKYYQDLIEIYNSTKVKQIEKEHLEKQLFELFEYIGSTQPSCQQIELFIQNNPDQPALIIGDMLSKNYQGLTSFTGDANSYKSLDKWAGVCTDTHSVITAMRTAFGQVAYLVNSSGNDAFHVFCIFKNNDKTWSIQNYGNIYKTTALTINELYNKFMPEQRFISIYKVASDGSLHQFSKKSLTATGLKEEKFRGNIQNSYLSNDNMFSPPENRLFISNQNFKNDKNSSKVNGFETQINYKNNQKTDIKYQIENNENQKNSFKRIYKNIFCGMESVAKPLYWANTLSSANDNDLLLRLGGRFETNSSETYGNRFIKLEKSYTNKLGTTLNLDVSGKKRSFPLPILATYGGQSYHNLILNHESHTGVIYKYKEYVFAKVNLTSNINPGNARIDGIKNIPQQINNIIDNNLSSNLKFTFGNFVFKGIFNLSLDNIQEKEVLIDSDYAVGSLSLKSSYLLYSQFSENIDRLNISLSYFFTDKAHIVACFQTSLSENSNFKDSFLKIKVKY